MTGRERTQLAREIFPDPDGLDTLEQWERTMHHDLPHLDREALQRELGRARLRLLLDDAPSAWLTDRIRHLRARLEAGGNHHSRTPAPARARR